MTAFIQLSPDPYSKNKDELTGTGKPQYIDSIQSNRFAHVRRPTRGTQSKIDTYATLEIKTKTGQNLLLYDAGGLIEREGLAFSARYSNFLIQAIQEQRAEKYQILETFGVHFLFLYGDRPTMLGVSGQLLNSADFNWKAEFKKNYDLYIRGTKCVDNATTVYLSYDDYVLRGYILNANFDDNADVNELCNFNFQMIIAGEINLSNVGDPTFPIAQTIDWRTATELKGTAETLFNETFPNVGDTDALEGILYGKISENDDEYIERQQSSTQPNDVGDTSNQYTSTTTVEGVINSQLDAHGIDENASRKLIDIAKSKEFKTLNLTEVATKGIDTQNPDADSIFDSARNSGIEDRIGRA